MVRFQWFRLHSEVRADPKLRVLPYDERWVFICLLCFASEQEERGTIPPMSRFRLAAEVADGDLELLDRTLGHLVELDIVSVGDDGTVRFVNWRARQYDYPSDEPEATAERKRRQRERESQENEAVDDVTSESRVCHEPVTSESRASHEDVTSASRVGHEEVTSESRGSHEDVTSRSRASHEPSRHQNTEDRIQRTELITTTTSATEGARANGLYATVNGVSEATDVERDVVACIRAVPGMQHVPDAEILEHYRVVVRIRGPCSDATERLEAMRFRDYWTERRKGRNDRWRGWKNAVTNWFSRTKEVGHAVDSRGARTDRAAGGGGARALPPGPAVDYDRYARYVRAD